VTTANQPMAKANPAAHKMRGLDYLWFCAYQFAFTVLWGAIGQFIIPNLNERLLPAEGLRLFGLTVADNKLTALGWITFPGLIIAAFAQPMFGAISDGWRSKVGKRVPFVFIGTTLTLISVLGLTLSVLLGWWWLLFFYGLTQLFSNVAFGPYHGLLPDRVLAEDRGKASGALGAAQMFGQIGSAIYMGISLSRNDLAGASLGVIIIVALGGLVNILLLREQATDQLPPSPRISFGQRLTSIVSINAKRYPDFVWLLIARLFSLMGFTTITTYALYYIQDVIKLKNYNFFGLILPDANAGYTIIQVIVISFSFISAIISGFLTDRYGRKPLIALSGVFGILGALALVFFRDFTLLTILSTFTGLFFGMFTAVDWAMVTDLIPRSQAGKYMGVSNLATAGAQALSPVFGTVIASILNPNLNPVATYSAIMVGAAIYYLIGILLLTKVNEKKVEDEIEGEFQAALAWLLMLFRKLLRYCKIAALVIQ